MAPFALDVRYGPRKFRIACRGPTTVAGARRAVCRRARVEAATLRTAERALDDAEVDALTDALAASTSDAEREEEAERRKKEAPKEAPPDPEATKKEAAAIVAAANKDYKQRLADREKAKTATAEDLQAMINAKLNISK